MSYEQAPLKQAILSPCKRAYESKVFSAAIAASVAVMAFYVGLAWFV